MKNKNKDSFWPSYVDVMTTLFAIMVVLFAVSYSRFRSNERELKKIADKYNEIISIYNVVENIDSTYFEFKKEYVKHIFRIQATYQRGSFRLTELEEDIYNPFAADSIRSKIIDAGLRIKEVITRLQNDKSIKQDIKYLVVIEGQASADGFYVDEYHNNDVLSYKRALELHRFWQNEANIDFSHMDKCELVISGSGEGGLPRYTLRDALSDRSLTSNYDDKGREIVKKKDYEKYNQRFLIHIVPVIGNISLHK